MKLLFLVTDDWYFLSHRISLAREARDEGHEVVVVTSPGEHVAQIEAEGFRYRAFTFRRSAVSQPLNAWTLRRLTRIYREERPDLVHHVSFLPIFYGSLAARRARIPGVVNAVTGLGHVFSEGVRSRAALRWAMERCYKRALSGDRQLALFQNEEDRGYFLERGLVDEADCRVVPGSGVDMERFDPGRFDTKDTTAHDAQPTLVHASRMLWTKGVGDTVEASRRLRSRGVAHRLVLAGRTHPSNPESISEETLHGWESEGLLSWIGHTDDMPALYHSSALVCFPSAYREGIPMALLEASAAGRPIVTTDVPGCRDVVEHGTNGLLVPARDPGRLAEALEELLSAPERRRSMGAAGRERALARFSKEIVNASILACYRELLGTPAPC